MAGLTGPTFPTCGTIQGMATNSLPNKGAGRTCRVDVRLRLPINLRDALLDDARDLGVSLNTMITTACAVYREFLRYERTDHEEGTDNG